MKIISKSISTALLMALSLSFNACGGDSPSLSEVALKSIATYARDGGNTPNIQDYTDAGVSGVTAENLDEINAVVSQLTYEDVDTQEEVQALSDGLGIVVGDITPPTFTSSATASVPENQLSAITLNATDSESAVKYSINSDDYASFNINTISGVVTFKTAPDFETKQNYSFRAVAKDTSNNEVTQNVSITVSDVDPEPMLHNGVKYLEVTSPYTQRVWLDRNLGASQACTALDDEECYGDYYQWERNADGHQISSSDTNATQATNINNAGKSFITSSGTFDNDWAKIADADGRLRSNNWSKTDGSSVCPVGFRIPTIEELTNETTQASTTVTNNIDAYNNFLHLPSAGYRYFDAGSLNYQASDGIVWSSSATGSYSHGLYFDSDGANTNYYGRAGGFSVRCLKDESGPDTTSPTFISSATVTVEENQLSAITLNAIDSESAVTYSINSDDYASFNINTTSGVVTFKTAPNFEMKKIYSFRAVVKDIAGNSSTQNVSITILDAFEQVLDRTPPTFTSSATVSVNENQTSAITLRATDNESSVTYSINSDDATSFNVNPTSGVVTFKTAPNYEVKQNYSFEAVAKDVSNNTSSQSISITILDIEELAYITHNGVNYLEVTSPYTQRVWLDRNLGASQACTALDDEECYGDYYQWGRNTDGHQLSRSDVNIVAENIIISPYIAPNMDNMDHGNFIILPNDSDYDGDWAETVDTDGSQRSVNWSKTDGTSVCPVGFRVPTIEELESETTGASTPVTNKTNAYTNFLHLPSAAFRSYINGSLGSKGSVGVVWSSSATSSYSYALQFNLSHNVDIYYRAYGFSVRCLKD